MNKISKYIDHTILKPESVEADIKQICEEAMEYDFKTVCIQPYWVGYAKESLQDSNVGITTVIGFPLGANTADIKAAETKVAIADGATEVDMVINIGALKDENYEAVLHDIETVVNAAGDVPVKVIIETSLLTKGEKIKACELAKKAGAAFVKTSTGFSTGGATIEDIRLMRATVGPEMGVKASGGVRNYEDAKAMIEAGATRIGASSGIEIVKGSQTIE